MLSGKGKVYIKIEFFDGYFWLLRKDFVIINDSVLFFIVWW